MNLRAWCAAVLCAFLAVPAVALEGPKWVSRVPPAYPAEALRQKIAGCVTLSYTISPDGLADDYQVVKSVPEGVFDKAAMRAINKSHFEPGDGKQRYKTTFTFHPHVRTLDEHRCDDPVTIAPEGSK